MSRITADAFRTAFATIWGTYNNSDRQHVLDMYPNARGWTRLMLDSGGVLEQVAEFLTRGDPRSKLRFKREWYTIDGLIVSGTDLFRDRLSYPSHLDVLIEHENGDNWEEEMWKLLFWKAPLKVLIGYDWNDDEYDEPINHRNSKTPKRGWLPWKLSRLREMHSAAQCQSPEREEYLLLVGNRANRDAETPVKWRWCKIEDCESALRPLADN